MAQTAMEPQRDNIEDVLYQIETYSYKSVQQMNFVVTTGLHHKINHPSSCDREIQMGNDGAAGNGILLLGWCNHSAVQVGRNVASEQHGISGSCWVMKAASFSCTSPVCSPFSPSLHCTNWSQMQLTTNSPEQN